MKRLQKKTTTTTTTTTTNNNKRTIGPLIKSIGLIKFNFVQCVSIIIYKVKKIYLKYYIFLTAIGDQSNTISQNDITAIQNGKVLNNF